MTGLTLQRMTPGMWGVDEAEDLALTARGSGFTEHSVVRWGGEDRPTDFVSASVLSATISAADVGTVADVPVTVYDATTTPIETAPLTFHVVQSVSRLYLPLSLR